VPHLVDDSSEQEVPSPRGDGLIEYRSSEMSERVREGKELSRERRTDRLTARAVLDREDPERSLRNAELANPPCIGRQHTGVPRPVRGCDTKSDFRYLPLDELLDDPLPGRFGSLG